jgi:hypothetical protein
MTLIDAEMRKDIFRGERISGLHIFFRLGFPPLS